MSKAKLGDICMVALNLIIFLFTLVYVIVRNGVPFSNVLAVLTLIGFSSNMIYGAVIAKRFGYLLIALNIGLFFLSYVGNYVVGLSIFESSISILGNLCLTLIPIFSGSIIFYNSFSPKASKEFSKLKTILMQITSILGLSLTVILLVVGLISLSGKSVINTNTVNLAIPLIMLAVCGFSLFCKGFKLFNKPKALHRVVAVLGMLILSVTIVEFSIIEGAGIGDAINAQKSFEQTFGKEALKKDGKMRNISYSIADEFIGIKTSGYEIKRDVEYYTWEMQNGNTTTAEMTLRYDMYYPTDSYAHKSVLVNFHGGGGDKDTGNYAHRNKYFASIGYVVYDIQFGDSSEKNIGNAIIQLNSNDFMKNIDEFFRFASTNNEVNANFKSIFITGVSFGGGLTSQYAQGYANCIEAIGGEIKGIIPIYPAYMYNDMAVNKKIPCLMAMSMSDNIVNTKLINETELAYKKVNYPYFVSIKLSYAGHGCDNLMSGRSNQLITFYMERFMNVLK